MRQVVLDTETTGLSPQHGHRLTEIGCLELVDRKLTGRHFHTYLNPEREVDQRAAEITGLTWDKLRTAPKFVHVVEEFLGFIADAELIIHNAAFDLSFLDNELYLLRHPWGSVSEKLEVVDTLVLSREMFPGQRNSLDALCKRFAIDNSHRTLHGALLDAEILASVYLAMTAGQTSLDLMSQTVVANPIAANQDIAQAHKVRDKQTKVIYATAEEMAEHVAMLQLLKKDKK
jgi:DNA polymerase III subunit epsilon